MMVSPRGRTQPAPSFAEKNHPSTLLIKNLEASLQAKNPDARELVREDRRNSQDRVDVFLVDYAPGLRLRLPD